MQDILDHLADLTAAEPADAAAEKLPQVGPANLLEIAQTSKKPAQDDELDTFAGV